MIKRSFGESHNRAAAPQQRKQLKMGKATLRSLQGDDSAACVQCFEAHSLSSERRAHTQTLMRSMLRGGAGPRYLAAGRVLLLRRFALRNCLAMVLRPFTGKFDDDDDDDDGGGNDRLDAAVASVAAAAAVSAWTVLLCR
jgi:hypothetical protein